MFPKKLGWHQRTSMQPESIHAEFRTCEDVESCFDAPFLGSESPCACRFRMDPYLFLIVSDV